MIATITVPLTMFLSCVVASLVIGAIFGWIAAGKDANE